MKISSVKTRDTSILIANALDHFDTSLYSFLAPLLAPLFFPATDPLVQVILAYSVMATSLITRPLGALLFGTLVWHRTPLKSLCHCLMGVAISTIVFGFLPTYEQVGGWAPALLIAIRMIKGIFASGESTLAKLYILDNKTQGAALKASYFYQNSSLMGIILASGVATWVISTSWLSWRLCFWLGGSLGVAALVLRRYDDAADSSNVKQSRHDTGCTTDHTADQKVRVPQFRLLWRHRVNILRTSMVSGFSQLTYAVPFVLMNTIVPQVTTLTLADMMAFNTGLLVVDLFLFPVLGRLSSKFNPRDVMMSAATVLSLTILPLFQDLPQASWTYVTFVRFWFIIWGVLFACPLNFWLNSLFATPEKYLCVGLGNAVGTAMIGRTLTPICLGLWAIGFNLVWPAVYLTLFTSSTAFMLYFYKRKPGVMRS